MKKHLLLFILVILIIQTKAQTSVYHPFPDSNAYWNEHLQDAMHEEFFSYIFSGDTLIRGTNYHKISKPFIYLLNPGVQYNYAGYSGCIRQDSANKKVYAMSASDSIEQLLYDFNLQIGDTLKGFAENFCPFNVKTITAIDSAIIGNNYRKRWNVSGFSIIEGIGSNLGLFDFCFEPVSPMNVLACFQQNGKTLYPDTNSVCNVIDAVIDHSGNVNQFGLFPNPTINELTVHLPFKYNSDASAISITNIFGQTVFQSGITSRQSEIDVSSLSSGIYFVQVSAAKERWTGNFIKE